MERIRIKDCQRESHFTFIWTIENGSALLVSSYIESPKFIVQSMERTEWMLELETEFDFGNFEIYVRRRNDNGPDSIQMEFELSVLDNNGAPLKTQTSKTQVKKEQVLSLFKDNYEVLNQRRSEALPDDELTVRCRMWRTAAEELKSDLCFARTCMGMNRRSFIWAIREFSSLQQEERRTHYLNPVIHGTLPLVLNLFLGKSEGENYVNIQISQNYTTKDCFIICNISLLDNYGRVVHSKKTEIIASVEEKVIDTIQFYKKDKIISDKSTLLQNDILSLRCEFQFETEPIWSGIENYRYLNLENLHLKTTEMLQIQLGVPSECCIPGCSFKKTLEVMYRDESSSDVTLRAGGLSLAAHKSVLSARSPVFKVMFTHEMREKTSKIVDIPDFDADTVDRLLRYIYKNTVEDLEWESAADLFRAADKYELLDLRNICSAILAANISLSSVYTILSLADMHEDRDLLKAAEDFILRRDNDVFDSDEWKILKEENSRLALEVMERIIRLGKRKNY